MLSKNKTLEKTGGSYIFLLRYYIIMSDKAEQIKQGVAEHRGDKTSGDASAAAPSTEQMMDKMKSVMNSMTGGRRRRRGGATRRKASLSRRRSYRRRVKASPCRKKGPAVCRSMKNCKFVSKKRRYCRKSKNTKRRSRGGARRGGARRGGARRTHGGARRGGARRGGARR